MSNTLKLVNFFNQKNIKMKWGSFVGSLTPLLLLQTVCLNAEFDVAKCSTSIHPDYLCQKVTEAEMRMHTFHGGLKPHVARKHCKSKIAHQGFFLFSNKNEKFPVPKTVPEKDREEWDDVFHIKLPALLRQAAYKKAFSPIFARIIGQEKVSKKFGRFGDGRRLQLKLSVAFKVANNRLQQASSVQATRRAQAEIDLLTTARRMLANHYRALIQVFVPGRSFTTLAHVVLLQMCPYEVPRTIDDGEYLSFIQSRDGAMPQDIHMDSFAPGWSFLTALEHDQELLILWNGHKVAAW